MSALSFLFPAFFTILVALVADPAETWDSLPKAPDRLNLWLGRDGFALTVLVADILGVLCSLLGILFGLGPWISIPIVLCLSLVVLALAILFASKRGWAAQSTQPRATRPSRWWRIPAVLAAFAGAFFLGTLIDGKNSSERPLRKWSPYHVEATETNGAGFVNVCPSPSPCTGKNPIGQLREGEMVYIDCQLKYDLAETIAGDSLGSGIDSTPVALSVISS